MSTKSDLSRAVRTMRTATARRDLLIVRMRAEGASLRAIAHSAGLTHEAVRLICDRAPAEADG